jgi:hypothetical protein
MRLAQVPVSIRLNKENFLFILIRAVTFGHDWEEGLSRVKHHVKCLKLSAEAPLGRRAADLA